MKSNIVRIRYVWFPNGTSIHKAFFQNLFNSSGYIVEEVFNKNEECDFEINGVYQPARDKLILKLKNVLIPNTVVGQDNSAAYPHSYFPRTSGAKNKIWLTLENVRPPVQDNFLVTISYDQFDFDQTNFYVPAWYMLVGLFGRVNREYEGFGTEEEIYRAHYKNLLNSRMLTNYSEKMFAYSIYGNPHPVRLKAIQSLSKIHKVDIFGRITGTPVTSKFEIGKKYKFAICFENNFYPGYVTEKLLQAYTAGSIPIYWGHLGDDIVINRESFINMCDFSTTKEFIDYVEAIDEVKYKEIYERPFLTGIPDIEDLKIKLIKTLDEHL